MSRKDAVTVASRTLALLLVVWALADASSLPEIIYSSLRYINHEPVSSAFSIGGTITLSGSGSLWSGPLVSLC
jgi:hypothetical protein